MTPNQEEEMGIVVKEKEGVPEEKDFIAIIKITADEPKNDSLTKGLVAAHVNDLVKVLALNEFWLMQININKKGAVYKPEHDLVIQQTSKIPDSKKYSSQENTNVSFYNNVGVEKPEAKNSPHEFPVPPNMLDESSQYMEYFRGAYLLFQMGMRADSNRCYQYVAMCSLKNVLMSVSRRLNEKGPRSRVHFKSCPQIFEEACREAGVTLEPLPVSECEDLLEYNLHFPSGCRMVLAIPMNNSEAKEKGNKSKP